MSKPIKLFIHTLTVLIFFILINSPYFSQAIGEPCVSLYVKLIKAIKFIGENFIGITGFFILYYLMCSFFHNLAIKYRYKREWCGNDIKYIAQRCYEDGYGHDENGNATDDDEEGHRDYFYLVERKGHLYHRIVDTYTLQKLGYPRPSRKKDKCFKASEKSLGEEIKINNVIADIKVVWNLKS